MGATCCALHHVLKQLSVWLSAKGVDSDIWCWIAMLMPRRPKAFSWPWCVRHFVVGAATRQAVLGAGCSRLAPALFQDACRVMYAVGRWTFRVQQCIRFCVVVQRMSGGWVDGIQWPASLYNGGVCLGAIRLTGQGLVCVSKGDPGVYY